MAGYPLPPELTARVISYLTIPDNFNPYKIQEPARVAQYATVSRDWQMIVERHTFSTLHLTTPQRLTEFEQIVAQNARRRSYVRNVNLLVQLESYDVEARAKFETAEEHRRNNEIFTRTIQSLFKILQSWPEDQTGIHLSIKAQSPSDAVPGKEGQRRMKEARKNRAKDLLERRFEKCYLQFSEESLDGLPAVGAVTTLSVDAGYRFQRLISPASCAIIASKLPRLQNASLVLLDNEKRDLALRKRNRNEFVCYFNFWPSSVEDFYLVFYNEPPANQTRSPADLVDGNAEDPLSSRLRDFSQQLTAIHLEDIVVGKELFWPIAPKDDTQLPSWPKLTSFRLQYTITTPSGGWYFERNPAEEGEDADGGGDSDLEDQYSRMQEHLRPPLEDRFPQSSRTKVSSELINEFYVSAGRAAQRMPKLKYMHLETSSGQGRHWFQYEVKGKTATATWADMILFQPEERVLEVWRDAARQHTGSESNLEVKLQDLSVPYTGSYA